MKKLVFSALLCLVGTVAMAQPRMTYEEKVVYEGEDVTWVSGYFRLAWPYSRIKSCQSVHKELDIAHTSELSSESLYFCIE